MYNWLNKNSKALFNNHNGLIGVMATKFDLGITEAREVAEEWLENNHDYEGDFITLQECESCGWQGHGPEEEMECPECEGMDIMNYTSHEGSECTYCGRHIDMWTDVYVNSDTNDYTCELCMEELEHILDSIDIE